MSATPSKPRELAHRTSNGIDVSLFWTKVGNVLTVEIHDAKTDEFFSVDVPSDRALDAFRHPYAYLAAADSRHEVSDLLAA